MGIPKFARFLMSRYPLILKKIKEEGDVPEIDNLFLDINGVIHKRAHNNNVILMCKDRSLDEIFYDIFCYIDELVHLTKPKKLLMISADGVAPRAKMNQQRSRRFRKTDENKQEHEALRKQGLDPEKMFNSDVISAGTEFMFSLSKAFDTFVNEKLRTDALWKDLKVVLTGVDVPGEGEHKIVEYIRQYKNSADYDASDKHCIYGLDADLIMLSLITHEPNICILREEVVSKKFAAESSAIRSQIKLKDNFEFIYVSILREYLELEFLELKPRLRFEYNVERVIDDFIFFCFFIGNDFLPNLNTLDIDHGALDNIFLYYKEVLPTLDDYITYHGKIDFKKAEKIFACLAAHELSTIQNMLKKVEVNCKEREKKRSKAVADKKKIVKIKKLMVKKENFLVTLKQKDLNFIVNFKKERVKNKIIDFKRKYEKEVKLKGKEVRFEEDLKDFMSKEVKDKMHDKDKVCDNKGETSHSLRSDSNFSNFSEIEDSDSQNKQKKTYPGNNAYKMNEDNLEAKKGLIALFDSDDENKSKTRTITSSYTPSVDNLTYIIKSVSKYNRYIHDDNYCSDLNIDDIEDRDVGEVSDPDAADVEIEEVFEEGFNKNLADNQDLDKVFQQKLLNLYITDVNKAKAFYYKEKLHIDLETREGVAEHKNMFRKYLEGLQWVLYYYYRGIQSWRWYYPYHYAPMISDFQKIKEYLDYEIDKSFNYGEPYSPFQSLLFILPRTSRNLFPECYWGIFEEFPHLFPSKFGIDFNGKKMPWESVVLLPFLQEDVILHYEDKMRNKYHPENSEELQEHERRFVLSDLDIERNVHGKSYIFSRRKDGDITKESFEIYSKLNVTNLDSNYQKKTVDYHFPTLKLVNYDYTFDVKKQYLGKHRDQIKKTKLVALKPIPSSINEERVKSFVNNKTVFVNYPFKAEGIVRGVCYNNYYYYLANNKVVVDANGRLNPEVREAIGKEWFKRGVHLDNNLNTLVEVSLLKRIVRNCDGSLVKLYEDNSSYIPIEVTSLNSVVNDCDKLKRDYETFSQKLLVNEFEIGGDTLVLSKTQFGMIGNVKSVISNSDPNYYRLNEENYSKHYDKLCNFDLENRDWDVPLEKLYNGPLVEVTSEKTGKVFDVQKILNKSRKEESYISLEQLSHKIEISAWTLGLITSGLFVVNCTSSEEISDDAKISELEHWNIGLNLKSRFKSERLILPGFSRYIEGSQFESSCWEFSNEAVQMITAYREKYSFVFECLEKYKNLYNRSNKFFRIYELLSSEENSNAKLTEIAVWINSLDISTVSFTSYRSIFLSRSDCRKIEDEISSVGEDLPGLKSTLTLNPNFLFQETLPWVPPFMAYEPLPFCLGDRVVNLRSNNSFYIPFGLKGTVTAVANEFIEVMFDEDFLGGSTLNGRFSSRKGAYVKPLNLINLTNKPPVYLRRNKSKYPTWNFLYYCGNFDALEACNLTYDTRYNNKSNLTRQKSDGLNESKQREKLTLEKTYSYEQKSKLAIEPSSNGSNNIRVPKIIRKNIENAETVTGAHPLTNYNTSELIQQPAYVPKRIITKEYQPKINSAFKTNPQGAKLMSDVQVISNEKKDTNVAEYRKERQFQNENLPRHQLYFYGNEESANRLRSNKNIILNRK